MRVSRRWLTNRKVDSVAELRTKPRGLTLGEEKPVEPRAAAKKTDDSGVSFRDEQKNRFSSTAVRSLTGWCFSCKATVRLPLLPGGATILCHFWNKVVFKQSRGDNAYALCLDISSCIGSRITHNCKETVLRYVRFVDESSPFPPPLRARSRAVELHRSGIRQKEQSYQRSAQRDASIRTN